MESISAFILAGGRATRMGRVDKGLQPFRGLPLAAHVLQRLAPQAASVTINANRNLAAYGALGVPVLQDELQGYEGPLAGLQTGLRHCATDLLLTAPCDSPFLPADLAQRLYDALQAQGADLAVAATLDSDDSGATHTQPHPVFCLVRKSALPALEAYLASGARRMDGWYRSIKVAQVLFSDANAFRNINTLAELQKEEESAANPALKDVASCLAAYDPDALPVRSAQRVIRDFVQPVRGVEKVALRSALDRVLAEDVISPINVPAHDNSAMDGYAFAGSQLKADANTTLKVIGTALAGRPTALKPGPGECVRIMTGGVMPDGCDTVLPQELAADLSDVAVTIAPNTVRSGDNRRFKGEDLAAGLPALRKGKLLRPADLGLVASLGLAEVPVQRRLRVAFFSTGDELRSIGEPLADGCVYDSNRYTLFGMLQRLGCDIVDMGIVKDDAASLEAALRTACECADAVITSGGVSVGAADYTKQVMAAVGDVHFWKINMRPGRPLAFGRLRSNGHSAYLFGLPGNPVAVMVSFYFFARHALLRMMGAEAPADQLLRVRSAQTIRKKPGRTEYQRGILSSALDGTREVRITGSQGSGILRSMSEANCMLVLPDEQGNVAQGDMVDVILFEGLL
ncbi:molybdenum cofactor guanylyltransferase MobA [Pseudoduganella sp. DS3]|uniref:Molybdenum cofactor guanylyltransferase n=1 Tax=Pseudoduganella guangdongensis TaxID=2692179 RepID=A0A6N9HFN6_9BURK|nr:gephyrin-like molybdotransferase Glp [Pseudoduganella guangdongensis]MYN01832.1 molybdenum cofactor guanylyltransferase MobA [Pseudoduganella guangdongensis]